MARPPLNDHRMNLLAAFDWGAIWDNRGLLSEGLWRTIQVSRIGIVGATVIGIVLGAVRANRIPVLTQLAAAYVEIIRNTPILVQIFMLFYGLPTAQPAPAIHGFTTACLAVTIWGGAFNTENFRAGFEAVPYRYREAGLALGFSRLATFFRVTLPIGGRIALPSTINTYVSVLKNTSLMTAIGFQELTTTSRSISASNFATSRCSPTVAVVYLAARLDASPAAHAAARAAARRSRRRDDPSPTRLEPRHQHRDDRRSRSAIAAVALAQVQNRPLWWDPVQHQIIHVGLRRPCGWRRSRWSAPR